MSDVENVFRCFSVGILRFTAVPEQTLFIDPLRCGHFLRGGIKRYFFERFSLARSDPAIFPFYLELFDPDNLPRVQEIKRRRNYQSSVPKPISLDTTQSGGTYQPGEPFSFNIVLSGYLCHPTVIHSLIFALDQMGSLQGLGEDGRFLLLKAESLGPNGAHKDVYEGATGTFSPDLLLWRSRDVMNHQNQPCQPIRIELCSPLQLRREGKPTMNISFALLIDAILHRLEMLQTYFCEGGEEMRIKAEVAAIVEAAENIHPKAQHLDWIAIETHRNRALGGLIGNLSYEGEINPFLPYLALGSLVGIGKKTTFGLGRYRVEIG